MSSILRQCFAVRPVAEGDGQPGEDPEPDDDRDFLPPTELEVMM